MTAVLPAARTPALAWPRLRGAAPALVILAAALFMFADARPAGVQLWDESRVMVNALEMRAHGLSLVTTYGGRPDLWNTKPPLLVWAMVASSELFGANLAALRLPAMLSALGVVAVVYGFARRLSGSAWTGALAAALLVLSFGFSGLHCARTADYDAPLTLFTTGYAALAFLALHRRRPPVRMLAGAALLAVAAVLTKSVAGAVPGLGLLAYAVVSGRWRRLVQARWLLAGFAVLAAVALFLAAREAAAPGYLRAALYNDVAGRFGAALDRHGGSGGYYLMLCFRLGFFSAGPLGLLAPAGLAWARGRTRRGLVFALAMAAAVIAVDSAASTKLPQYAAPAYPFLAIACALAVHALHRAARGGRTGWLTPGRLAVAGLLALGAIALKGAELRYLYLPALNDRPQSHYGRLFAALAAGGVTHVRVLDGGAAGEGLPPGYTPELRAEILMQKPRGLDVARARRLADIAAGAVAASCDPRWTPAVAALGRSLPAVPGCAAALR